MLRGRLVAKTPEDPVIVVSMRKVSKRNIEFIDGCESCEPEQLLLECSNESFDASVSFWTSDKGRARSNADESQLILKCVRDELTSMIVSQCDACGDVAIECFARCTNRLTKRVDRFVTRAALCGTRSETLTGAVIDHDEGCRAALIGHARSAIDCPHLVWSRCDNRSIMHARTR